MAEVRPVIRPWPEVFVNVRPTQQRGTHTHPVLHGADVKVVCDKCVELGQGVLHIKHFLEDRNGASGNVEHELSVSDDILRRWISMSGTSVTNRSARNCIPYTRSGRVFPLIGLV